ncbi:hypothetical protein SCHPADRAFT_918366 [Schizopora paradoxa]|uniref:Anaphase-promoting complex subunit 4 n=1 Tax=Schizopora paradoxa TaxID=27342 RepID=A0A0H2S7P3_9AGAM|nr:hypothetical protein SCHPADRAFT_918366 [Schizopora paradoxa]
MEAESSSAIVSLAYVRLQLKSRLLSTACCPDKDLVVIISRTGTNAGDKMSLWKMQGSKKWEVETGGGLDEHEEITALGWSPDGQTIVVTHNPPRITLHSIQDGSEERSLPISPILLHPSPSRLTGVWWFKQERKTDKNALPDMFRRGDVVTGSALSILRTLPLLDPLQDDTLPLNAADLFAFQGNHTRPTSKASGLPDNIASWPALPADPLAASIKPSPRPGDNRPGEELDEKDLTNVDSVLVAADIGGRLHCFLDGSYPLGAVTLGPSCEVKSLMSRNEGPFELLVHAEFKAGDAYVFNNVAPFSVQLPLLGTKAVRRVAENSSAARELTWYIMRVVKEMRNSWFGGEGLDGAREMNLNYVRGLEERQTRYSSDVNPVFDLTCLLTTGKSSPALSDFNQTGDQTSDRGLQKWESMVGEALLKLRDYSEKRVAPACQRLHLILEEVRGWSLLPQLYGSFEISVEEIDECLNLAAQAIVLASWLAAVARQELFRFTEFMLFLRYETGRLSSPDGTHVPRHDILEVNEYLMSGLAASSIDKWFIGPVPHFSPGLLATPHTDSLRTSIDRARQFLADPSNLTWPPITRRKDLSHLDRNIDALVQELTIRCQQVFDRAASAAARKAIVDPSLHNIVRFIEKKASEGSDAVRPAPLIRTRAECDASTPGNLTEHMVVRLPRQEVPSAKCDLLCMARSKQCHEGNSRTSLRIDVAILECRQWHGDASTDVPEENAFENFHVHDLDFFDAQSLVIVGRSEASGAPSVITMVDYADLSYHELDERSYVNAPSKEDIVAETIGLLERNQLASVPMPIRKRLTLKQSRRVGSGSGMSLSVNGRPGRRIACVLDGAGNELEMVDMEGEEEEEAD